MQKIILTVFLMILLLPASFASQDVKYAGFAFPGGDSYKEINFKYTTALINSSKSGDGLSLLNRQFLQFFTENQSLIRNFNLLIGDNSKTSMSLAIAITWENLSVEHINDFYKIVANLALNIMVLDFETMKVVVSYPLYFEYRDQMSQVPSDQDKVEIFKKLFSSDVLTTIKAKLEDIKIIDDTHLTLRVVNVAVEPQAIENLGPYTKDIDAFKAIFAQKFSDFLSNKLKVSMLPYAKDGLNTTMALQIGNSTVQFKIPEGSYGIDLTLRKLTKEQYKESVAEVSYLYGAYGTIKVSGISDVWEKKAKYGAVKIVPRQQVTVDDFAVYDEMNSLLLLEFIKEMQADKKFYKEVLERCLNK